MGDTKVATFVIDSEKAELGVQRMTRLMQLMNKTAEEARKELSQMFVDVHGQMNAPLDKNKKQTDDNTKAVREFRQEQRLQNYVIREGSQTLMSLVFALSFLAQGEKNSAGTTKVLMQSLMTGAIAMNSLEMTAFSLNRAFGKDAAGNVTKFGEIIGKWGGPIAMAVAGIITLISLISESGKAAKEAAEEGLKKYREELEKLTPKQREQELKKLEADRAFLKRQMESTPKEKIEEEAARAQGPEAYEQATALSTSRKAEAKAALEILDAKASALGKYLYVLTGIKKLEDEITTKRNEFELEKDPTKRLALADELVKMEYGLTQAKKNSAQIAADTAEKEKIQYEMHKSMAGAYLAALEAQKKATVDPKARLEIEQKINDVKQEQIELEQKRGAARLITAQKEADADEALFNLRRDLEIESVLEPMKREQAEQDRIHTDRMADIEELASRSDQMGESEQLRNQENVRYANALNDIQNKYYAEGLRNLAEGFQAIEQGLSAIGARSDSVLTRMIQMAQIAIRISQALSQMNQPGGDQTSGYLSIIGNLLGFVGLFDSGGWTGPGSRNQVAGLVHKDEIVFEQPITQRYRNELLSLRKGLQRGIPMSAAFPMSDNGGLSTAIVVSELRSLKAAVQSLEIQSPIIFRGLLDSQKMVREELPGAQTYMSKKFVDKQ
jgi:hypothetical protein